MRDHNLVAALATPVGVPAIRGISSGENGESLIRASCEAACWHVKRKRLLTACVRGHCTTEEMHSKPA